ncbi:UvrD-helicase domain-containing protein [Candidatus Kinetoplastidibacterium crithidiae]|uniref:DNA 3'-5' helicase n=1 Tax=Candidatus Kinetoplastidibacterium crithidiae TCC036E TaxID=1208918 RepID=M1M5U9_9PROT|nr:UvrD-helicase domain-containing protein [Candidatus Kinetoplastibacterium crithidii]AFZ82822.1 DNA helicase II / ATP-dependent DNA helicase PcrA [Candidatus Kinetoplastibacterium crithidii (ex Angomonas deanei ATCC 30255)]AGF47525.1 DNA helicase II/ATP-dependent DNA helicase PcrA [Candidatus Kinetoplastibacterium crithidii TCC036E]
MNLDDLNNAQRKAVTTDNSHSLVLAGAGSGKTKVLSSRIAWLINTGQASFNEVLAVTFTNKAAREMVSRISMMLDRDMKGFWIGTFHGLCHKMLRLNWREANLIQNFQIIDMSDQLSLIKRLMKSANVNESKYSARDLQKIINSYKEKGLRSNEIDVYDSYNKYIAEFYHLYEHQCIRDGLLDFAELLLKSYDLLKNNQTIRNYYQERFKYILVDEFQDTNSLQYGWLRLLIGNSTSVFAVGDDDQSIYAFRGANIDNMSLFDKEYAKGNIVRLEQNYRSMGHILGAANSLIRYNNGRLGKKLWTQEGDGEKVLIVEKHNDLLESQWIVDEIKNIVKNGIKQDDIAVLYRSNAQSRVLEHALFLSGISYKVYGGLRFFERQEIKNVLAYLRLIVNRNDDSAWLRSVNFPIRGIGTRTIESLFEITKNKNISLYDAVAYHSGRSKNNLLMFNNIISTLEESSRKLTLVQLIEHVLEFTGINAFYKNEEETDRLDNLKELVTAATIFSGENNFSEIPASLLIDDLKENLDVSLNNNIYLEQEKITPLLSFLSHASLEAGDNQSESEQSSVQLMTVHAAKGLEFKVVFITGVEEGLFPHENSMSDNSSIEEERRLMYVAITRARKKLYITMANSRMLRGQVRYSVKSRFISEVGEGNVIFVKNKEQILPNNYLKSNSRFTSNSHQQSNKLSSGNTNFVDINGKKFVIGQNVKHKKFGDGTIIKLIGHGEESQAQISFNNCGIKTIMLGIARFE